MSSMKLQKLFGRFLKSVRKQSDYELDIFYEVIADDAKGRGTI